MKNRSIQELGVDDYYLETTLIQRKFSTLRSSKFLRLHR